LVASTIANAAALAKLVIVAPRIARLAEFAICVLYADQHVSRTTTRGSRDGLDIANAGDEKQPLGTTCVGGHA